MTLNKSTYILELAKELLDDIELNRTKIDVLLLKASRLARFINNIEIKTWIECEINGYDNCTEDNKKIAKKYIKSTGRENKDGYIPIPLAQINSFIEIQTLKIQQLKIPSPSGNDSNIIIREITNNIGLTTKYINEYEGIKSRVIGLLHKFVSNVYYDKLFDNLAENIFNSYKEDIDLLIVSKSSDLLEKIPAVIERLSNNDKESISHALTTCRRIIDNFADSIYPPTDNTIKIGENDLKLTDKHHLNRINAFIHLNCNSKSRKQKFRQNLSNLYDRVSAGVHSDVDVYEAKSLFLNTYLIIGEILQLQKKLDIIN